MADDETPEQTLLYTIRDAAYHVEGAATAFDNDRTWRTAEYLMAAEASIQRARLLMVEYAKQRGCYT